MRRLAAARGLFTCTALNGGISSFLFLEAAMPPLCLLDLSVQAKPQRLSALSVAIARGASEEYIHITTTPPVSLITFFFGNKSP